jgi:hypothetical protein
MIQDALAKQIFKNLGSLNISPPKGNAYDYHFKDTLKQCLLESSGSSTITIEATNKIRIEISTEEFATALFSDFHFGLKRIKMQINNVNNLTNSDSQVAWIVTTAYYACYFMAVEITKLYGMFIINFSEDELIRLIASSKSTSNLNIKAETNNSFQVSVRSSSYQNILDLQLVREASRPHQIVWTNSYQILNRLTVNDHLSHHKNLLIEICDNNKKKWKLPNTIRNEWNYTYADYYSDRGTEIGDKFLSIIKKPDSAMSWASRRKLQPDEKNITASIAYLYHCLSEAIKMIESRFYQS